jgi:hypothetical protein
VGFRADVLSAGVEVFSRRASAAADWAVDRALPWMVGLICVALDLDETFAAALERTADSVVVWIPSEPNVAPRMQLEQLTATIRRFYRPAARFGRIEVWRRTASASFASRAGWR